MTIVKTKRIQPGYEPIEGYVLQKRLGQGGYGEVWRAKAPGGLLKAVKFVFGQHDERRASQELKSLERIKSVQHPFILTLERFELIENQLVIVTELADGSLEDVYHRYQGRGSCGIPRDALLRYMRDAADALDYLHQLYKLQHLDIKPANLLMVGGRVKVADFGLLKDLGDVDCSIVGGLTPIYAPPEVFDGRPSMHSDQYSLAVMYQELLTSTRPFSGRTIAQLATQHVHNAPNLKPLPAADRPCVARALEKSPDHRFGSCSEFVERLANPHGRQSSTTAKEAIQPKSSSQPVENLPVLQPGSIAQTDLNHTQALVVALGGTGSDCLNELRLRINELGTNTPLTLHSVLIDSDLVTTQTAKMIDATDAIPRCHVIDACLRRPKEYRDSGTERLRSVSRRWIYNVPRKGNTGGMRPLGRLALVDHGKKVLETLRAAVEELKDSLPEGASPKVYVVGSLTGGTGSGMYIDVVHLLRHLLDDSALENTSILSFLTTNRFQGDPARPLALHATKSAISEIAYFLKPGNGYPGDAGAGWPSLPAARTPLGDAYIIAQSDRLAAPNTLDAVVNYLWLDATVCDRWFSSGRSDENDSKKGPMVRSMNIVQIGDPAERHFNLLAPQTAKNLLLQWLGNPRDSMESAKDFSRRIIRRCYLDAQAMPRQTERWFGNNREDRRDKLTQRISKMDPTLMSDARAVKSELARWLTQTLDLDQTEVLVGQIRQQIDREIALRLQDRRMNLSSTITGLGEICKHLQTVSRDLLVYCDETVAQLDSPPENQRDEAECATGDRGRDRSPDLRKAVDLGEKLVDVITTRAAATAASRLEELLSELTESYSDASARIAQAIQRLNEDHGVSHDPWSAVDATTRQQLAPILDQLHNQSVTNHLSNVISSPSSVSIDAFVSDLTSAATFAIREVMGVTRSTTNSDSRLKNSAATVTLDGDGTTARRTDVHDGVKSNSLDPSREAFCVTQTISWTAVDALPVLTPAAAMEAVRPPLMECGGKQRLYLLCRDKQEEHQLRSQIPQSKDLALTTILTRSTMPMLVHEGQGIELDNILAWLDALTGDDGRISARLATRCDVDWT